MKQLKLLPIILLLFSCSKENVSPYAVNAERFHWSKGDHWPSGKHVIGRHNGDTLLSFGVRFDYGWIYDMGDPIKQLSWNKLGGMWYGSDKNSVRAGVRYNIRTGMLEIGCYVHKDGQIVHSEEAIPIVLDPKIQYRIEVGLLPDNRTFVRVQSSLMPKQILIGPALVPGRGGYHGPYFGGSEPSPRPLTAYIQWSLKVVHLPHFK